MVATATERPAAGQNSAGGAGAHATLPDIAEGGAPAPKALPAAVWPGIVVGVGLLAAALIAAHDLVIRFGWLAGTAWTTQAASWLSELHWQDWMWPTAVGLILVGLVLLVLAGKPRHREYLHIEGALYTRRGDIARRSSAAARALPGVDYANTVVGRRRIKVSATVSSLGDAGTDSSSADDAEATIHSAVEQATQAVRGTRQIAVKTQSSAVQSPVRVAETKGGHA